jgi:hypothetical protein
VKLPDDRFILPEDVKKAIANSNSTSQPAGSAPGDSKPGD